VIARVSPLEDLERALSSQLADGHCRESSMDGRGASYAAQRSGAPAIAKVSLSLGVR
jgi:hypothetical protein